MKKILIFLSFAVCLAAYCQEQTVRLSDDSRLTKKFTKNYEATSFKSLLEDFTAATGADIKAGNKISGDLIILSVKDKSYAEIMAKIAEHFDFGWEIKGSAPSYSYVLSQPTDAAKREYRNRLDSERKRIAKIREVVAKVAKLSDKEIDGMREKYKEWAKAEPKIDWKKIEEEHNRNDEWQQSPEEKAHQIWQSKPEGQLSDDIRADRRTIAQFLSNLSDQTWDRIAAGDPVSFCTAPRMYQLSLANQWIGTMRDWCAYEPSAGEAPAVEDDASPPAPEDVYQGMNVDPEASIGPSVHPVWSEEQGDVPNGPGVDTNPQSVATVTILVRYGTTNRWMMSSDAGGLSVNLIGMDRRRRSVYVGEYRFDAPTSTPSFFGNAMAAAGIKTSDDTEEKRPEPPPPDYSKDPILGRKVVMPKLVPDVPTDDPTGGMLAVMRHFMQDMIKKDPLNWVAAPTRLAIADSAELCLISDAFDVSNPSQTLGIFAGMQPGGPTKENQRVGQALDEMKANESEDWVVKDGWISLRNREYGYYRPRQMPRDTLVAIYRMASGSEEPTIDQLASLANSANELQYRSLSMNGMDFLMMASTGKALFSPESRAMLRLWSSLSPFHRNTLTAGKPLSIDSLMPNQKANVIDAIREYNAMYGGQGMDFDMSNIGEEQTDDKGPFRSPTSPFDWAERVPQSTSFPLSVSLESTRKNGFYVELADKQGGGAFYHMSISPSMLGDIADVPEDARQQMEQMGMKPKMGREESLKMQFRIHLTDRIAIPVKLSFSKRMPNSDFDIFSPPQDVKDQIAAEKKKRKKMQEDQAAPPTPAEGPGG